MYSSKLKFVIYIHGPFSSFRWKLKYRQSDIRVLSAFVNHYQEVFSGNIVIICKHCFCVLSIMLLQISRLQAWCQVCFLFFFNTLSCYHASICDVSCLLGVGLSVFIIMACRICCLIHSSGDVFFIVANFLFLLFCLILYAI